MVHHEGFKFEDMEDYINNIENPTFMIYASLKLHLFTNTGELTFRIHRRSR